MSSNMKQLEKRKMAAVKGGFFGVMFANPCYATNWKLATSAYRPRIPVVDALKYALSGRQATNNRQMRL
jgi:hypothetical protein